MYPAGDFPCTAVSRSRKAVERLRFAFSILLLSAISTGLYGQPSTLTGRVLDSTNALLPGVTVEATPAGGGTLAAFYNVNDWLAVDAEYAYSRGRFRDDDPAGDRIPGAVEGVASVGLNVVDFRRLSGELRDRYFGPRPLVEDDSVRSEASSLFNARIGYRLAPGLRLHLDVFNILDAEVSDIDYFYASRLPGEAAGGVHDIHFHPVETRSFRLALTTSF